MESFRERPADLVLLDLMLPDLSGIAVGQAIRDFSRVPILVLSARSEPDNKVLMLRSSADDYVTKPFHSAELLARIEALLRRSAGSGGAGAVLSCGDLTLDRQQRCIRRRGQELHLSPLEFRLLAHFMEHPDRVLSKEDLLLAVWGHGYDGADSALHTYVHYLRHKLEDDPAHPKRLLTRRGRGYLFVSEA